MKNEIVLFQSNDGKISLPVTVENDTVWLSQNQMIQLFGRDQSVISRHINNAFKEEVDRKSNMHFLHIAKAARPVAFYSLDVIICRVPGKIPARCRIPQMGEFCAEAIYHTGLCCK